MVMCWAPDCKHYNQRETCKFFKFPTDAATRRRWKNLIRRDVEPGPGAFLCSCHFKDGKREEGPTLFQHNVKKRFAFTSPEKRKRKKSEPVLLENENSETSILQSRLNEPQPSTSTQSEPSTSVEAELSTSAVLQSSTSPAQDLVIVTDLDSQGPSTSRSYTSSEQQPFLSPALVDAENFFLKQELQESSKLENLSRFSYEHVCNNDKLILLYTGIPTNSIFSCLIDLFKNVKVNYFYGWTVQKLSREDQILITLMKLRQNFPHEDLAVRFNVSQSTISNVITTWVHVLHEVLFKKLMAAIPPRNQNKLCLPNCFSTFTNCRIVLDCTEIYTCVPRSSMAKQEVTYSSYKSRNTWKGLVGVAPNGVITFVSDLYPGSTSDKKIVQDCGILEQLQPGDLVLADKGFLIKDCLPSGVSINIPPFLNTAQFTPQQVQQTESIARARIHVERAIRRMKCYQILSFIPQTLLQHADVVFQVVAALTNLQFPLIKEVQQYYCEDTFQK